MTTIHLELDDGLLQRANAVLSERGLSLSGAIQQWLALIADKDLLPIEPENPNETTIRAMREREEDLPSFTSTNELMAYLHENR
uniref:Addiction module antitoxin, RelB/DinJ family n=1 Tax=Candidatus Kentrum sp. MB TaxID=2138164 RepID=A0A450XMH3_9GAMM|nr:MAG: addiction module antitoxin, RelB/DinJ family [Candidatus Kentron sp. MB]VFK30530.1 MAG: addiction module antitoxin, RelB/DinJ family [Candidatus Kentron sp. MB]VFK75288.1 MAG: addiction module antitoxin, RelB/DinJ family [Candidatus Kentron sp. MB]